MSTGWHCSVAISVTEIGTETKSLHDNEHGKSIGSFLLLCMLSLITVPSDLISPAEMHNYAATWWIC